MGFIQVKSSHRVAWYWNDIIRSIKSIEQFGYSFGGISTLDLYFIDVEKFAAGLSSYIISGCQDCGAKEDQAGT